MWIKFFPRKQQVVLAGYEPMPDHKIGHSNHHTGRCLFRRFTKNCNKKTRLWIQCLHVPVLVVFEQKYLVDQNVKMRFVYRQSQYAGLATYPFYVITVIFKGLKRYEKERNK